MFGKVLDSGGAPVEGATVRAVRSAYAGVPMGILRTYLPRRWVDLASTRTDAHGRFELRVDPSLLYWSLCADPKSAFGARLLSAPRADSPKP